MAYVRARRLSEAARALAAGAPDILSVALDWGYGSHEAFSRAFRDQFDLTPEAVRARGTSRPSPDGGSSHGRLDADAARSAAPRGPARAAHRRPQRALRQRASAAIPAQWQRFTPHLDHVPGQVGHTAYGVVHNSDDTGHADYLTGVEVKDFSTGPGGIQRLTIPPQRYAVFTHKDHISSIRRTWFSIWNKGLPEAGLEATGGPEFERYDERFDGRTGNGEVEILDPDSRRDTAPRIGGANRPRLEAAEGLEAEPLIDREPERRGLKHRQLGAAPHPFLHGDLCGRLAQPTAPPFGPDGNAVDARGAEGIVQQAGRDRLSVDVEQEVGAARIRQAVPRVRLLHVPASAPAKPNASARMSPRRRTSSRRGLSLR